jgi:hypothetical protein
MIGIATLTLLWLLPTINAQAPDSIAGRTIELTITSGTWPFESSGVYRFLPSALDNHYVVVPMSGDVAESYGTYSYSKTSSSKARLSFVDFWMGQLVADCTFSSSTSGSYVLTAAAAPGASQRGNFRIFSGNAPTSIAGGRIQITVLVGDWPFSSSGEAILLPAADGTYVLDGLWGITDSQGNYSYTKQSSSTALIMLQDSVGGTVFTQQISFDSNTSGTYFVIGATGGYQAGTFLFTPGVPPSIQTQPRSVTVTAGGTATFTVTATGTAPLAYQWKRNGVNIPGATAATLTLQNVTEAQAGTYTVVVSNAAGSVTSQPATLTVNPAPTAPVITGQPQSLTVTAGGTATFTVTATGTAPLAYQWKRNGVNIPGATAATLTLQNVTEAQAGTYTVVISNTAGSVTSMAVTLTVLPAETRPRLSVVHVETGKKVELNFPTELGKKYVVLRSVDLSAWTEVAEFQGTGVSQKLTETIGTTPSRAFYRVRVDSAAAAPQIIVQPASLTVPRGSAVRLTVQATGTEPLQYQWRKDGVDLVGKTSASLTINSVQSSHAGYYTVVVFNAFGSVESQPALLEVETGD